MARRNRSHPRKNRTNEYTQDPFSLTSVTSQNQTDVPDISEGITTNIGESDEFTKIPEIDEEGKSEEYAGSAPALIDKILSRGLKFEFNQIVFITSVLWFSLFSWLFIQDNQMNRLESIYGLKWFGIKAISFTFGLLIFVFILIMINRKQKKKN